MATKLRPFDPSDLVSRIKSRHALKADSRVGIVGCFDTKAALDKDGGNYDIVAVATTDGVDLDDEVVLPEGADLAYLKTNRKLFADHCYDNENAVATLRSIAPIKTGDSIRGWKIRARLFQGEIHKAARLVESIIAQDGIGLSIGFVSMDDGRPNADEMKAYPKATSIVRACKLLEVSFTCLPCNVSCQTMQGVRDEGKAAEIAERSDEARKFFRLERPRLRVGF